MTASAMAPLPRFACHADGGNCEHRMSDPVLSLASITSIISLASFGLTFLGYRHKARCL